VKKRGRSQREYDDETVRIIEEMAHYRAKGFSPRVAHKKALVSLGEHDLSEASDVECDVDMSRVKMPSRRQSLMERALWSNKKTFVSGETAFLKTEDLVMVSRTIAAICDRLDVGELVVRGQAAGAVAGGICSVGRSEFRLVFELKHLSDIKEDRLAKPGSEVGIVASNLNDFFDAWKTVTAFEPWREHIRLAVCIDGRPRLSNRKVNLSDIFKGESLDLRGFVTQTIPGLPLGHLLVPGSELESSSLLMSALKTDETEN